jgi:hypothetical protein
MLEAALLGPSGAQLFRSNLRYARHSLKDRNWPTAVFQHAVSPAPSIYLDQKNATICVGIGHTCRLRQATKVQRNAGRLDKVQRYACKPPFAVEARPTRHESGARI